MKKNGFMIYELVISFALAFAILLVIFNTSISLNRRLSDLYVKNKISSKQIILNKKIGNDFTNKEIQNIISTSNTCNITYSDNTTTNIEISNRTGNKYIMVGNEKILFDDNILIEAELNKEYKTIDELEDAINKTKIPFDKSNYFVKKAEEELDKIKNRR